MDGSDWYLQAILRFKAYEFIFLILVSYIISQIKTKYEPDKIFFH